MIKKLILAAVSMVMCVGSAFAYRPLSTEDAGVAGEGVAQTEISWDYLKWENDDEEQVLMLVPIYGVTEKLELSVEIPYLFHNPKVGDSEEGVGDVNIVGKYLLVPGGEDSPSFAVKGIIKMDNGDEDKGLGSGDEDYSIVAAMSYAVGRLTGHAQFGYTWVGDKEDDNLRDITLYGVALDFAANEEFHVLAEVAGNKHPDRTENDDPLSALAGLTYKVSEKLTLDAAYRWGLNDSVPDWSTTFGASITY